MDYLRLCIKAGDIHSFIDSFILSFWRDLLNPTLSVLGKTIKMMGMWSQSPHTSQHGHRDPCQ